MSVNLENLSPRELDELIAAAAKQKQKARLKHRQEVRRKLEAMAREEGFTIEELFGSTGGRRGKVSKVAPKYRNPADPSQTWTGRGKRPLWVQAHLDAGGSLEALRI
ncbi:MAG: DNA-binding protein [Lysobacteraceae bacterium]|nr:MAG: DNA-binding protein [Xanthomonadaceae bacterium]